MSRERRCWTPQEDELLREAVSEEDPDTPTPSRWHAIAMHVPGRSNKDCRKRWISKMASNVSKGVWAPDEDERLVGAVGKYGASRWAMVATMVKTRNSDQCAKRWMDTLDPSIDRTSWTAESDALLLYAVECHGKSWAKIVRTYFPGRTGLAAKNRFNSITRSRRDSSTRSGTSANSVLHHPSSNSSSTSPSTTPGPLFNPLTYPKTSSSSSNTSSSSPSPTLSSSMHRLPHAHGASISPPPLHKPHHPGNAANLYFDDTLTPDSWQTHQPTQPQTTHQFEPYQPQWQQRPTEHQLWTDPHHPHHHHQPPNPYPPSHHQQQSRPPSRYAGHMTVPSRTDSPLGVPMGAWSVGGGGVPVDPTRMGW